MRWKRTVAAVLLLIVYVQTGDAVTEDASVFVAPEQVSEGGEGKRIVQDVTLSTSIASYVLRYDIIEKEGSPERVGFQKWAPSLGYTPLGIAGPCMANWYNQGFFVWTFDGFNIQDFKASFRVIRSSGQDAMVEYVWDTPKVKATARFAVTAKSDKLLFFGAYEPKEEIQNVQIRLMAYPSTFDKPWIRAVTTSLRTLTEGSADLDLERERWVLLEDLCEERPGAGQAGLLLGDISVFSQVSLTGIGGYAEYVDLALKPNQRNFALGFYEFPSLPSVRETRAHFRAVADDECNALAKLNGVNLDEPLEPLPVNADRVKRIARQDDVLLDRPVEAWNPPEGKLSFPWAASLEGAPLQVALLVPRWAAYDTMELARRLEMEVDHQYFDTKDAISNPRQWPYRNQTGVGPLGASLATRNAVRISSDENKDLIVVAGVSGAAIGDQLQCVILNQVRKGKGLFLSGDDAVLAGWPAELTEQRDDALAQDVLQSFSSQGVPGMAMGEKGRLDEKPFLEAYRVGEGRVLIFRANVGRYQSLLPLLDGSVGLNRADDRVLAFHALGFLSAANRALPIQVAFPEEERMFQAGVPGQLNVTLRGQTFHKALVRIQNEYGDILAMGEELFDEEQSRIRVPALPATSSAFVDLVLETREGECVGMGGAVIQVAPAYKVKDVRLSPASRPHAASPQVVELPEGGDLHCVFQVEPFPKEEEVEIACEVWDCFNRELAREKGSVSKEGRVNVTLSLPKVVTIWHELRVRLVSKETVWAQERIPFTVPLAYPYDDFTVLMWSYARGERPVRIENRLCYEMGADMMDLCHMRGYTHEGAAREYAVAARSGLRLVPYVTRIAGTEKEDHGLVPSLFDETWFQKERNSMKICCLQAAPYRPAAYTLGDENYLSRGRYEVEVSKGSLHAFRRWLKEKYGKVAELNETWGSAFGDFQDIREIMLLEEAVHNKKQFAPWFDFRRFMDSAFVGLHERFAEVVRKQDPGAKVGWDGLLRYHWLAGYDFVKMTRNLELNQVYTSHPLQGELVRSFKRPDALTGEWGNAIADKEDGFSAIGWHNLFRGHNSCWWWTSWGCDYIPFCPDLSVSSMGDVFFKEAREIKAGPGRLLVQSRRHDTEVGILYSQTDLFAFELGSRIGQDEWPNDITWQNDLLGAAVALKDLGYGYRFVDGSEWNGSKKPLEGYKALFLAFATCLSDEQAETISAFARGGGLVVSDGRIGLLTENGRLREASLLQDLVGARDCAAIEALGDCPKTEALAKETPLIEERRVGEGMAVSLLAPFAAIHGLRSKGEEGKMLKPLGEILLQADIRPLAFLEGERVPVRCAERTLFADGTCQYLGVQQDILVRGLGPQKARLSMDDAAFVYDVRQGRQIRRDKIKQWDVDISRGRPLLFALLPYRVTALSVRGNKRAHAGETVSLGVAVHVHEGKPQRHVVHVDVFPPGAERPHRQYSHNIDCEKGEGRTTLPFALNDPVGPWRIVCTDAATGVSATHHLKLKALQD